MEGYLSGAAIGSFVTTIIYKILDLLIFKKKYVFQKMHEERANVIKELYRRIVDAYRECASLINPIQLTGEPAIEKKIETAGGAVNEMIRYFETNRLFFNTALEEDVDKVVSEFRDIWYRFLESRESPVGHAKVSEWNLAWKKLTTDLTTTKKELEASFREQIGIT